MTDTAPTPTGRHSSHQAEKAVIVGLDQSGSGRAALDWAAGYARLTGQTLRAISVVDWPTGLADQEGGLPLEQLVMFPNAEQSEELQQATQGIFDQVGPEPGWDLQFRVGHVGRILARESQQAQLLVIGTGQHVGLGRILIGSTSHYCLSHASCPVVAVPSNDAGAT